MKRFINDDGFGWNINFLDNCNFASYNVNNI